MVKDIDTKCALLENLDKLHTTELGIIRIKKNLLLNDENAVEWCYNQILSGCSYIKKRKELVY